MDRITVRQAYEGVRDAIERYGMDSAGIRTDRLIVTERAVPIVKAEMQCAG
jgi:hypothetical protein